MKKLYLTVGTWDFKSESDKGINLFECDEENGSLHFLKNYDPHVSAGSQAYDVKRNILYVGDECENHRNEKGGGGFVRAYHFNENTGELEFLNEKNVLMSKPAYIWLDPSLKYLMIACHSSRNAVTKVTYDSNGKPMASVLYDDAGIVLLSLYPDGSLGDICDVVLHQGLTKAKGQVHSHPHSVKGSPDGSIYYACDKGLDRIFSYSIDRKTNRLIHLVETSMQFESAPRYSVFHPTLHVWYENNETNPDLYAFKYDPETGAIHKISQISLYHDGEKASCSDIAVDMKGQYLYAAIRYLNEIAVLSIDCNGAITLIKKVHTTGTPRGLAISPNGKFLYTANAEESSVSCYSIQQDGTILNMNCDVTSPHASNIQFLCISK